MANINGDGGDNTLPGSTGGDLIIGFAGNDTVFADNGNDVIYGGDNNTTTVETRDDDELHGEIGDDMIFGEMGADELFGEGDNDVLFGGLGGDQLNGGGGIDTAAYLDLLSGVSVSLATGLTGGGAAGDALVAIENLTGTGIANDTLTGDDSLVGNVLDGAGGNDVINGRAGADELIGSFGLDTLTGGFGPDRFVLRNAGESVVGVNRDVITDFKFRDELDRIDVRLVDANVSVSSDQNFAFIGSNAFTAPGQLRGVDLGSTVIVQGSNDGDTAAEFEIALTNFDETLVSSDFIL